MTEEDFYKQDPKPEPVVEPALTRPTVSAVEEVDTRPAPKTSLDEDESRAFWREYGRDLVRGSVQNIDAVGRQVILVDGLLVGLYAGAVAFGNLRTGPLSAGQILLYLLPVIFLLFSLMFAGGMFFMEKVPLDLRAGRAAKLLYTETVRNKLVFLRTSMLLLALAVVAVIGALWVYLSGG